MPFVKRSRAAHCESTECYLLNAWPATSASLIWPSRMKQWHALACAGQTGEAQPYYRLAAQAGKQIAEDDDWQQFETQLAAGPWFDLVTSQERHT